MKNYFASERSKLMWVIGLVAICAGLAAKNVISYPTECLPDQPIEVSLSI